MSPHILTHSHAVRVTLSQTSFSESESPSYHGNCLSIEMDCGIEERRGKETRREEKKKKRKKILQIHGQSAFQHLVSADMTWELLWACVHVIFFLCRKRADFIWALHKQKAACWFCFYKNTTTTTTNTFFYCGQPEMRVVYFHLNTLGSKRKYTHSCMSLEADWKRHWAQKRLSSLIDRWPWFW